MNKALVGLLAVGAVGFLPLGEGGAVPGQARRRPFAARPPHTRRDVVRASTHG